MIPLEPVLVHMLTEKGKGDAPAESAAGLKLFVAIYSTFLQRSYDPIVHDVALQGLPLRIAIDRAGLVGADGAAYAGMFDVGLLSNLPGFVVMAATDEAELVHMVAPAAAHDDGPITFRYPRREGVGAAMPDRGQPLRIGRGPVKRQGADVAILSFGGQVLHDLAKSGGLDAGLRMRTMTLTDRFIDQASPADMYAAAGLSVADIVATVISLRPRQGAGKATTGKATAGKAGWPPRA